LWFGTEAHLCCGAVGASKLAAWSACSRPKIAHASIVNTRETGLDLFNEALRLFLMSGTSAESNRSAPPAFERFGVRLGA
jgi:hypothetical protein